MKIKYILIAVFLTCGLSSCIVSKKKYDTLNMAKQASDRKVRNLLKEKKQLEENLENKERAINSLKKNLNSLKEEFNNLKYDMSASNAQKSSEIDNLTKKLNNTLKDKANFKEKSRELEGDLNWLRKERQRNTEKISQLEIAIRTLENKTDSLKAEKNKSSDSLEIAQQKIEDLTSNINAIQELLNREKATNIKLQKQLSAQPAAKSKEENIPEI